MKHEKKNIFRLLNNNMFRYKRYFENMQRVFRINTTFRKIIIYNHILTRLIK